MAAGSREGLTRQTMFPSLNWQDPETANKVTEI
jgi:hypothetical protein